MLHVHGGHDRSVQGLHAPAELHRRASPTRSRHGDREPDDIVLTPLPLFHFNVISICVVGSLLTGGSAAIERRFSVSNFWPEVSRTGATMVTMLGSLAILIANADDHPDQVGHRLRFCAAAPMPPDTDRTWQERFGCKTFSGGLRA